MSAAEDASQHPQRQDSLYDQMVEVLTLARWKGCYDAYDWIADRFAAADWSLIDGHLTPPQKGEPGETRD